MPWDAWVIFLFLAVVVPWRGRARIKKLLAMDHVGRKERIAVYIATIALQWFLAAVVGWRAWSDGLTASELGLGSGEPLRTLLASFLGVMLVGAFQWMNLRRVGRLPIEARGRLQAIAERLLPQDMAERLPFLALAATAGVCEEFLYRGFAMATLRRAGLVAWEVVAVSSFLFGLAHLYQGRGGLVGTLLVGAVFGTARIAYHSLIPVALWHGTLDAVAGVAGPRYLLAKPAETGLPSADRSREPLGLLL
jgi:membrane protease YdiL (CAAX protease family)